MPDEQRSARETPPNLTHRQEQVVLDRITEDETEVLSRDI
jgi:hypothetical protein